MLLTDSLTIGYRNRNVLCDLNLELPVGRLTAFIGHNGAGKSTLLRTLTGELKPIAGEVILNGRPMHKWSRKDIAAAISIVTTDAVMGGALTVRQLVALGRDPYTGMFGSIGAKDREIIEAAMRLTGIVSLAERQLASLSDGERQKCMIARALTQDTAIVILDEPFSYLDVAARVELLALLRHLCAHDNKTILFSTHDVAQALRMADHIWMIDRNGEIATGTPHSLIENGLIDTLFKTDSVKFDRVLQDFVSMNFSNN